jgi:alpha-D-ribose 1-methylphosphonate 5-triphosphate synthase subunit PhnG
MNGVDMIEALQHHQNYEIYQKSSKIIKDYGDGETIENANTGSNNLNGAAGGGGKAFNI